MPHNRFFISHTFALGSPLELESEESNHLRVMRAQKGDVIELVNGKGELAEAVVEAVTKKAAFVNVQKIHKESPSPKKVFLALAFLKPNHFEIAIEKATELGIDGFLLFPGMRSEKKAVSETYFERLQNITVSALKQCGRLYLPEITVYSNLAALLQKHQHETLLYGDVSPTAPQLSPTTEKSTIFLIGPESGLSEDETSLLLQHKAKGVRLHQNILRAETAAIAATTLLVQ